MSTAPAAPVASLTAAPASATSGRPAGRHRAGRGRRILKRTFSVVTSLLLGVAVLSLLFMTVAPRIFGYTTATMLTGSMVPTINPGDVILDTREPRADIAVGQIISYHIPVEDRRVESHRVVWVHHDKDGTVKFRTKGDANTAPDPWTAKVSTPDVWRVRAVLPFVGTAIRALREPIVHTLLAIALPALLVVGLLVTIWKPSPAAANNGAEGNESADPAADDDATEDGAPAEDGDTADDGPSAGRSRRRWRR